MIQWPSSVLVEIPIWKKSVTKLHTIRITLVLYVKYVILLDSAWSPMSSAQEKTEVLGERPRLVELNWNEIIIRQLYFPRSKRRS
jgi:hypothetical protein